jgi:leader peptidase (prepilin peptidase) / N-methyltransferase
LLGSRCVWGLLFGSFLNVVIYRLPRGQNVAFPPSNCPACGTPIRPWQNVPVVSWLLLRGKAACCGIPISPKYPLVELLGGIAGWAVMLTISRDLSEDTEAWVGFVLFAAYLALCLGLIAAAFIDLEFMILPDSITLGGAALGFATIGLRDISFVDALIGAGVGFAIVWVPFIWLYQLVRGFAGMGLGDAKLLLLAGAWFGWPGVVFAFLAGAIQGTVFALAIYAAQGKIEEPQAVKDEREEVKLQLAELPEDERAKLQDELEGDILLLEPEAGLARARISFGPFLILGLLEYLFFQPLIHEAFFTFLLGEY